MLFHNSIFSDKFFADIQAEILHYFETQIPDLEAKIRALRNWYEALRSGKVGKLTEKQQQGEFLDLLFETILGYEKKAAEWKLEKEYTFANGAEADGVLGFFGVSEKPIIKVAIELKGLRIDLDKRQNQRPDRFTPVQQAFHYAYQAKETCEWVIVSNFDEIRLYHASDPNRYESFLFEELMLERPVADKKEKITPKFFAQKYPNLPKFFYLLAYGQLYNARNKSEKNDEKGDQPSTKRLYTNRIKRLETITLEFYYGYKKYRKQLYEHILSENPNLGLPDEEVFNLANTIFDRLIFMRFAEEIGIFERKIMVEYLHFMKDIPTEEPLAWFNIKAYFRSFDRGYKEAVPPFNGELFKPNSILEQIVIQNEQLINILAFLKTYDFKNELKVDILGHIFEQSLNDSITPPQPSPTGRAFEGIRSQDGIFYTPEYITDFMIEETLMTYLEEHKQLIYKDLEIDYVSELEEDHKRWSEEKTDWTRTQTIETHAVFFAHYKTVLQNVKILDPACGSGAFLTRVFDYLLKENELVMNELDKFSEQIYEEMIPETPILNPKKGKGKSQNAQDMFGAQEAKENKKGRKLAILGNEILLNNLFGVDINQESVEITKLSLWLKTANKHKISLVDLSKNIKIGNSLISDKTLDRKAFDWESEFPFGKFDLIVGNPPYVMVSKNNPITKNYQWHTDLYLMFFERCFKFLLKPHGYLAFITPRFWLVNKVNQDFRAFMLTQVDIRMLAETSPFEDANTECIVTFLKNEPPKSDKIVVKEEINKEFFKVNIIKKSYFLRNGSNEILTFLTENDIEILSIAEQKSTFLGKIMQSKRGMEIGKNELRNSTGKPTLIGQDVKMYQILFENTFVNENEKDYQRLKTFFEHENMIYLRRVANRLMATISKTPFAFNKNIYGLQMTDHDFSPQYILALLNSSLLDYYYKKKFSLKKVDIFPEIQTYLFEALPIRKIELIDQQPFIEKVNQILQTDPQTEQFAILKNELDLMVFDLYGISETDIETVKKGLK